MLNTFKIYDELTTTMDVAAARKITEVITLVYEDLQNTATKREVQDLRDVVSELAQAQKRTEETVRMLVQEVGKLSRGLDNVRSQVGGLARSVSYALENEAYRKLPAYLQARHQLILQERLIRTEIAGQEINLFAKATRNGESVIVGGESVLRLDDPSKLGQLQEQVDLVRDIYHVPVIPLIITHYARPAMREQAEEAGVIVAQSFEWDA